MKKFDVEIHHEFDFETCRDMYNNHYLVRVEEIEIVELEAKGLVEPDYQQVAARKAMTKLMDEYFLDKLDVITIKDISETDMTEEEFKETYGHNGFIC